MDYRGFTRGGFFISLIQLKRRESWHSFGGIAIVYGIIIAGLVYLVSTAMTVDISDPQAMHLREWVMFVTCFPG